MPKLLQLNSLGSISRGCIAVGIGCIRSIRHSIPDAEITIWSPRATNDKIWETYSAKVIQHPWANRKKSELLTLISSFFRVSFDLSRCVLSRFARIINKNIIPPYHDYDIVIDPTMDGINDRHYGVRIVLRNLMFVYLTQLIVRKPMALVPMSIGPLDNKLVKSFAKHVLNKERVITVRGKVSEEYLKNIGVTLPKIYLAADLAFLLEPADSAIINKIMKLEGVIKGEKPIIGISPSQEMGDWMFSEEGDKKRKRECYLKLMAAITDYIIESYNSKVYFVPNSIEDPYYGGTTDSIAGQNIINYVKNKEEVKIISSEYRAEEIKGVIGQFDMFISCRMHAAIASTSMHIPTVAIAYGTKFNDVIGGTMNQQKCIVNVDDAEFNQVLFKLKSTIAYVWNNRSNIKAELEVREKDAREGALLYGKLVKQLIADTKKG